MIGLVTVPGGVAVWYMNSEGAGCSSAWALPSLPFCAGRCPAFPRALFCAFETFSCGAVGLRRCLRTSSPLMHASWVYPGLGECWQDFPVWLHASVQASRLMVQQEGMWRAAIDHKGHEVTKTVLEPGVIVAVLEAHGAHLKSSGGET